MNSKKPSALPRLFAIREVGLKTFFQMVLCMVFRYGIKTEESSIYQEIKDEEIKNAVSVVDEENSVIESNN